MKQPASLLRRLGAILYDALLLLALFFLATIPFIAAAGGEAVNPETLLYQLILVVVAYAFFVGFWCRRGSTLGMLAWGLRVERADGSSASLGHGTVRFLVAAVSWAAVGLGFFWQLWDKEKRTWHDKASGTYLMYYPKQKS